MRYCSNWADKQHKKWRSNPPGSEYAFSLHEIKLLEPGEKPARRFLEKQWAEATV